MDERCRGRSGPGAQRVALVASRGRALVALVALMGVASCAPRPPGDFRPVASAEIPPGKAVVYLYRPPSLLGNVGGCNTRLGGEVVGALEPGLYTHRFLAAGKTRVEAEGGWVAFVTVNLREGQEVFVRQRWRLGPGGFEVRLEHVPRISALPELEACSLVESPALFEEAEEPEGEGAGRSRLSPGSTPSRE